MKCWSEPSVEIIVLSPADILQNSGNDPFLEEYDEWDANGGIPVLK
ncbi:MAG: hypothetical protein J6B72_04275 [Clostridia bacterium]|nr:hypothetical protein [Clostridia bacterium]